MLIAFHKPFGVLCRFTPDDLSARTLAEFGFPPGVYGIGRLDKDSEGLLLLTNEAAMTARLLDPMNAHPREYWAQVEGTPTPNSLRELARGVRIGEILTRHCHARVLDPQPDLPPRNPPIRYRASIPTTWIAIELIEGRNRQVRRMTAAVGYPTLRLIRTRIGAFELGDLQPGEWQELKAAQRALVLTRPQPTKEHR